MQFSSSASSAVSSPLPSSTQIHFSHFLDPLEPKLSIPLLQPARLPSSIYSSSPSSPIALIVLNGPLGFSPHLRSMWSHSNLVIIADGACNQLYADSQRQISADLIPHFICGDLDSADAEALSYYSQHGTCVVHDYDQDSTDFDKCIRLLREKLTPISQKSSLESGKIEDKSRPIIIVSGGFGGRFDHQMAVFNTLYSNLDLNIILCDRYNISFLLKPGVEHVIIRNPAVESTIVGLIPIGAPCRHCWTEGLKWNLSGEKLEFGKLISSSNEFAARATRQDQSVEGGGAPSSAAPSSSDFRSETLLKLGFTVDEVMKAEYAVIKVSDPVVWTCGLL